MDKKKPLVSVIVAAYNEALVLAENVRQIVAALEERPNVLWELILINDGSEDETGNIIDGAAERDSRIKAIRHWRNFGQGRALRSGFDVCRGEVVVTLDADLSYGPRYIWELLDAVREENVEIVLASPFAKGGEVRNVPRYRHFLSRWGNRYLAKMSHYGVSTSTCVVRAYRREALDELYLSSDGMELQLEILMKAAMMGFRVIEKPAVLEWMDGKLEEANLRRVSKMKIFRTIRLYLMMGWLLRPSKLFVIAAMFLILPGLYMAAALTYRGIVLLGANWNQGFSGAVSAALQGLFESHLYTVAFCGGFLLLGIQMLVAGMLVLLNQFHFQELYKLGQAKRYDREG